MPRKKTYHYVGQQKFDPKEVGIVVECRCKNLITFIKKLGMCMTPQEPKPCCVEISKFVENLPKKVRMGERDATTAENVKAMQAMSGSVLLTLPHLTSKKITKE